MARLTASLVWVAMLVVLSVGVKVGNGGLLDDSLGRVNGNLLADFYFPRRIISKQNPHLSLADRNGTIVLARTDFYDPSQIWFHQDDLSIGTLGTDDGCRKPFVLVNFNFMTSMLQAIVPPNDGSIPVKLAPYDPYQCVQLSMLWTKSAPVSDFSAIRMFSDESKGFNGLGGTAQEGTVIGVLPTDGVNPNVQWKIVDFSSA